MGRRGWARWGLAHRNAKFLSEVTEDLYITTNLNLIFAEKYQAKGYFSSFKVKFQAFGYLIGTALH
jgi:hypothetical protein